MRMPIIGLAMLDNEPGVSRRFQMAHTRGALAKVVEQKLAILRP